MYLLCMRVCLKDVSTPHMPPYIIPILVFDCALHIFVTIPSACAWLLRFVFVLGGSSPEWQCHVCPNYMPFVPSEVVCNCFFLFFDDWEP